MDERGDNDGVVAGIEQLASLLSPHEPLDVILGRIADLSATAVPGSSRIAVSVVADGRPIAVAATDHTVDDIEQLQYALGEGPALSALADQSVAMSGSRPTTLLAARFGVGVNDQILRAMRMLHENPSLASFGFSAAAVLGDADRAKGLATAVFLDGAG